MKQVNLIKLIKLHNLPVELTSNLDTHKYEIRYKINARSHLLVQFKSIDKAKQFLVDNDLTYTRSYLISMKGL